METKTIMILGGGVGGQVAANALRRRLPEKHRIVLIEREPRHAFAASFPWVMTGARRANRVTRSVRDLVRPGIEVIHGEARGFDLSKRQIAVDTQTLSYDYLIVALGAELAPESIPGLAEGGHTFFTLDGAVRLHEAVQSFNGGKVAVVVSSLPYKCPGAPHEAAMLLADLFSRRGIRSNVDLHLFTPEPQPMPVAGPQLGAAVQQMLASQKIEFHPQHKLTAVDPQGHTLNFEDGASIPYDLLIAIPPHRGTHLVREAGLANDAGWIPVDRATLATGHEGVYAIGDATTITIPGQWKPGVSLPLPKAGVFAHGEALVVAQRIATEIDGGTPQALFDGEGFCALEAGGGKAGFAFGNFYAESSPEIHLKHLSRTWHLGKVLFEQWWLAPIGLRRELLQLMLAVGGKTLGIPVIL
ncbi:MAG: NAD(P)/FAD-dependent oxidoreductase [Armatimonadota bacterium]